MSTSYIHCPKCGNLLSPDPYSTAIYYKCPCGYDSRSVSVVYGYSSSAPGKQIVSVWDGDVRLDGEYIHIDSDPPITIQPELTKKIEQAIVEKMMKAVELARMGGCADD